MIDECDDDGCELEPADEVLDGTHRQFAVALDARVAELSRRYDAGEPLFRINEHHGIPSFLISAAPSPIGAIRQLHVPGHMAPLASGLGLD